MMTRDPRYDTLFEPLRLGPVTTKNRFYQVPHCTGMGYEKPQTLAAMREVKAEGGWGVVCTEYCSIHPSSDDAPLPHASLWDEEDVRAQALMVEKVHRYGALAGAELWYSGGSVANIYSRMPSMGAWSHPAYLDPIQCKAMDKKDITSLRRWHRAAALRARSAGFDIVYIYACHDYLLSQFLSPENQRSDEYGGSLENRLRLVRELIEDTKDAVGESCAVAVRFSAGSPLDEFKSEDPRAMIEMLSDLPDIWDIVVDDYYQEMGTSRFVKEAALEGTMSWVKEVTNRPVVSVGRFTSPDTMVRLIREGVVDLIGAARPSIADPYLPKKIEEGRLEDIRECIGCNICYSGDGRCVPIRCTQNPAMGEEWRRGWHPERIPAKTSDRSVLVVGAGPAGLEAARSLGQRGYQVTLAEARTELGGRVSLEARLPNLAEWARVRDWRIAQLNKLPNVEIYLDSEIDAQQILEFGADRVVLATGSTWRHDGVGRWHDTPIEGWQGSGVLTPDDIIAGKSVAGPVLIFDDDHYYMGGVIAEKLERDGLDVTLVTPAGTVSEWTEFTDEQEKIQARLLELGIRLLPSMTLESVTAGQAMLACAYTGKLHEEGAENVVMVTSRAANDALYHELDGRIDIRRVGDCLAPGTIATAVYSGHRYGREMDDPPSDEMPYRRERALRTTIA